MHNLLPRKRPPQTSTEGQEPKEEKVEIAPKPVTEELEEETAPKSEVEISESQLIAEASTTENKLSFLLASRRHNHAGRKPGTFQRTNNKQTTNEES